MADDNVIYGIDFAGTADPETESLLAMDAIVYGRNFRHIGEDGKVTRIAPEDVALDTTPSDYVAPPFDCA